MKLLYLQNYFELQYKRLNRKIIEFGLTPIVGYVLGVALFIGLSYYLFYKTIYAPYFLMAFCIFYLYSLSNESRIEFLKHTFKKELFWRIRLTENAIVAAPVTIVLILKGHIWLAVILLSLGLTMAILSLRSRLHLKLPTPFYKHPFEFAVGFRKTIVLYLITFVLAGIGIQVDNFNLCLFALLMQALICLTYFSTPEEVFYVWIFNFSATEFLHYKMKLAIRYGLYTLLPLTVVLILFFMPSWHIILGVALLGILYIVTLLLAKYAAYPKELSILQGFLFAIGLTIPLTLPFIIPYFYIKSKSQLQRILL